MPSTAAIAQVSGQVSITTLEFQRFRALVHRETGIALGESKRQLLCSRLGKRLRHLGYTTFTEYYEHLLTRDPGGEERGRMINAITTNKTDFFRERHHFDILRSRVLAPIAERAARGGPRTLRLWSAGCSSGEEPYSIALTVLGALPRPWSWDVKILATDIDTDMLAVAAAGIYPADRVAGLPDELCHAHFQRGRGAQGGLVRVRSEVRSLVSFERLNLHDEQWPVRRSFDAIFCRNVIIYFDRALQQELIGRFLALLKPGGHLFLGHSESLLGMRAGLTHAGTTVYQKVAEPGRAGRARSGA
jgi:chemotaxis protein methyltransferase CheR